MTIGDLVCFCSEFYPVARMAGRKNPGLVIEEDTTHRQTMYRVLWANGKITNEHSGLLSDVDYKQISGDKYVKN